MSVEENKEVVRRGIMARNTNDLDGFLRVLVEEWHEGAKSSFNAMTNSFPDINITIGEILGEGDMVAISWTLRATHSGIYQNIPATQKQITMKGIDIYTIENGKIKSINRRTDDLGLLKQLGVAFSWEGEIIT